jgi:hypothetical protein
MTDKQKYQREEALTISNGVCAVCGEPLNSGAPQAAHFIANTKSNRAKWGSFIIDHPLNVCYVESLRCNSKCNIGNNPGKCLQLVLKIVTRELEKYER